MGRPREHGAETRARLLAAAGRILAAEGLEALSLRRLAEEVGTTTRAVYSLFGGKDGLLSAMYEQMSRTLVRLHRAVPPSGDARSELLALTRAYRASARRHPNLYPLVFGPALPGFTPTKEAVLRARDGLSRVVEAIQRGIAQGHFQGRDADTIAHELWALVHGLASLELGGAFVSIQVGTLDDVSPAELAAIPIRYQNGRDNAWWNEPEETRHL